MFLFRSIHTTHYEFNRLRLHITFILNNILLVITVTYLIFFYLRITRVK